MRCWLCRYHSILHGTPLSVLHPKFCFLATSPNFADPGGGGGGAGDCMGKRAGVYALSRQSRVSRSDVGCQPLVAT